MSTGSFGEDVDLTMERAKSKYESELSNGIGNLLSRTLTMAEKYFNSCVPGIDDGAKSYQLYSKYFSPYKYYFENTWKNIGDYIDNFEFNSAIRQIVSFGNEENISKNPIGDIDIKKRDISEGVVARQNRFIQESEPWKLIK